MIERAADDPPAGWEVEALGSLVESIQYGHTASAVPKGSGPKFLRITDIQNGNVDWGSVPVCKIGDAEIEKYRLVPGDIVFARTGATTGKSYLIRDCPDPTVFASYLIRLRGTAALDPRFLWYFFQTSSYWRQIADKSSGIAQPGVNAAKLKTLSAPVAPLPEQARIVEAIETNLTKLDAAVAALERVQANLKRYRASVLKAAVEGRLVPTEAELARAEGREFEPASVLRERILKERRRRWEEAELAAMQAKGKPPKNDKWKAKYKEPVAPVTEGLPELPEGWCWVRLGSAMQVRGGFAFKSADYQPTGSGVPLVRQSELRNKYVDLSAAKHLPTEYLEKYGANCGIEKGDILVGLSGSLSSVSVYDDDSPALQNQRTGLLVPSTQMSKGFLLFTYMSVVRQIERAAKGVAVQNVSPSQIESLPVALPPGAEQDRIVAEVEQRFSIEDQQQNTVAASLKRSARLRMSILKWAFEGKLVDQDPNDEPASILLDRIRAERAASTPEKKARRPRKARKSA